MTQSTDAPKVRILQAPTGSGKTSFPAAAPYVNGQLQDALPQDYHLPAGHMDWRPHQRETLAWLTGQQPGVSMALVRTINLQRLQYGKEYGFDYVTGRRNWPCVHPLNPGVQADECLYGQYMHKCEYAAICKYLQKKSIAKFSNKPSYNYAYFMVARGPRERLAELGQDAILWADEGQELAELIIAFAGSTITQRDRRDYGLPIFPRLKGGSVNKLMKGTGKDVVGPAKLWLEKCIPILKQAAEAASKQLEHERDHAAITDATRQRVKRTDNLLRKCEQTHEAIESAPDDWYIRSGPTARSYRGKTEPGFIARPLTAANHFERYFLHGQRMVLMSATIGGHTEFARQLGLHIDDYEFRSVPNQFTPEQRPIHALDVPAMGARKQHETDRQFNMRFDKQAQVIADTILDLPHDWSGLLLVTSKQAAIDLTKRLSRRKLGNRVWLQPGTGDESVPTDAQTLAWHKRRGQIPNSIAVSWTKHTGYDGLDEKFVIVCKAPFPRYGSPGSYQEAWRKHSPSRYRWQAACQLAQGLGRTRRGRPQDYDTPTERRGFVGIADKSWTQVKKYLPKDILDAINE